MRISRGRVPGLCKIQACAGVEGSTNRVTNSGETY